MLYIDKVKNFTYTNNKSCVCIMLKFLHREGSMKSCRCGEKWTGVGAQPREREVCDKCGEYLHCCNSCGHFDAHNSVCKIEGTDFVGNRNALNYCGEFSINDTVKAARQNREQRGRDGFFALWST